MCFRMAFSRRKAQFCEQTMRPLAHAPVPCHTIKNYGWEKMDCSLPSHSAVLLLDGITGPRWQAGRREVSSSSIWPSGRWSGPRVPSLGSLQMCLVLLLFMSCLFSLQCIFTRSHFGPQELAGSCLRRGSYVFLSGLYFTQTYVDPKAYMNIASGPSPWRPEVWAGGWRVQKQIILCPYSSITVHSNWFFPIEIKS